MNPIFLTSLAGGFESTRTPPATGGSAAAERAMSRVQQLEARLERSLLTLEALWSLLRERTGMTDEQLRERILDVDLTDGILDGKVRRPPRDCPACARKVPHRFDRCMYCGAETPRSPFA